MFRINKLLRFAVSLILALALVMPASGMVFAGFENGEGACTAFFMGKNTTENGTYIWGRSEDYSTMSISFSISFVNIYRTCHRVKN